MVNGFSIINHPFWGTPIFGNTQISHYLPRFSTIPGGGGFLNHQQYHFLRRPEDLNGLVTRSDIFKRGANLETEKWIMIGEPAGHFGNNTWEKLTKCLTVVT